MTSDLTSLLDRARAWAADDPDDATRAELERLVAAVETGAEPADDENAQLCGGELSAFE